MKKIVVGALAAMGILAGSAVGAQAMPRVDSVGGAPLVEKTAGGCGPYAYRDWQGFCRPLARPIVVGRPVYYARPVVYRRPVVVRRVVVRPVYYRGYRRW